METKIEQAATGEELYRRFHMGDTDAFGCLVALYEDELFNFINGITNDYYEAKQLTIEAFARLAVSAGQFAGKSSLKTYLFTIGKNLALRHVKKRSREQHISYEEIIEVLKSEDETPYEFMEREENQRLLHEAIRCLKDDHRVVLILLYFEDMSYIQAGQVMEKSERQIKALAYRAKAALKKKLESEGFSLV